MIEAGNHLSLGMLLLQIETRRPPLYSGFKSNMYLVFTPDAAIRRSTFLIRLDTIMR